MLLVLQADSVADYVNAPLCLIYTSRNENRFGKILSQSAGWRRLNPNRVYHEFVNIFVVDIPFDVI